MVAKVETAKGKATADRSGKSKKPSAKMQEGHVGDALRSIYQNTVEESVPQDFLDILGKLA